MTGAPWLAVIDMQRVFAEPDSPWLAPRFAETVGPVRRLVAAFGQRVTFTRFVAPEVPAGAWRRYYDQWPFALQPAGARIYELVDAFAPGQTLDSTTFGKWGPELAQRAGSGPLVLAGVSTDCCVLSTALAAADAGVLVQVVADACAGITDESHDKALDILRLYGPLVEVVTLADIVGWGPPVTGQRSRAAGALYGLAIGDALGMPTQSLSRGEIVARFGALVSRFAAGPADHPLAAGLPAGTVTDDTEQAALLGQLIIEAGPRVDGAELARRLVAWEERMRARGSLDLLGPSTRRAVAALLAGVPAEDAGRRGTTNGAAMRITPVGVATPSADMDLLVRRVVAASQVTHNTGVALAGAAAVAAAVSAGIDGAGLPDAIRLAVDAAGRAATCGHWVAAADVAARLTWATGLVAGLGVDDALDVVYRLVGTSLATQESVPAAFAVLSASPDDPWLACRIAASLGGDCDTIAAMAGAIAGACHGIDAFPGHARQTIDRVNDLGLGEIAAGLLTVRAGGQEDRPARSVS